MKKDYRSQMLEIVEKRYGLETPWFSSGKIGLEDIEAELEANDEMYENAEVEEEPVDSEWNESWEEGEELPDPEDTSLDSSDATGDSVVEDMAEEVPVDDGSSYDDMGPDLASDGEFGVDDSGEYLVDESNSWKDGVDTIDDLPSDAEAINVVKIITNYTNKYVENMELFYKRNEKCIDLTGDIKNSMMYQFMQDSMKVIETVYKEEPMIKNVQSLWGILQDGAKMRAVCGNATTPFIYEGIQLILIETLRSLMALLPFHFKQNKSVMEIIEGMNLGVVKTLIQMCADMVEVSNLFGTRIYFVAPVTSEITGKSEELANTPYANLEETNVDSSMSKMNFAGESIMNLVQIKNNNALVEYSIISKMLVVISGLTRDLSLEKDCQDLVEGVKELLMSETNETVVDNLCETFRRTIIVPQIEKMAQLAKEEATKLTEETAE